MTAKMKAKRCLDAERIGFIYIIICLVNGKGYVGQTIKHCAEIRWMQHVKAAFCEMNQRPLYRAMRLYKLKNFIAEVIWTGPESKLNTMERKFIRERNTFIDSGAGYNLTTGGDHYKLSKAACRAISKRMKKTMADPVERERVRQSTLAYFAEIGGQPAAVRAKIVKAKAEHPLSTKSRKRIGARNLNRVYSKSERAYLSNANKATYAAQPERWDNTRLAATGRKWNANQYAAHVGIKRDTSKAVAASVKARRGKKGTPWSEQAKIRISKSVKHIWAQRSKADIAAIFKKSMATRIKHGKLKYSPEQCQRQSATIKAWWAARKANGTTTWGSESRTRGSKAQKSRFVRQRTLNEKVA